MDRTQSTTGIFKRYLSKYASSLWSFFKYIMKNIFQVHTNNPYRDKDRHPKTVNPKTVEIQRQ